MGSKHIDYQAEIGKRYGRLVVLSTFVKKLPNSNNAVFANCICDCGKEHTVKRGSLVAGTCRSCGCWHIECTGNRFRKHGMHSCPEYEIWINMKYRCSNPKSQYYHRYGERGIRVCPEWDRSFAQFIADVGNRPSPKHSLDRIDNDKGYSKENCRWADALTQGNNRSDNKNYTLNGETKTVSTWAREIGITCATLNERIEWWGVEKALSTKKLATWSRQPRVKKAAV